jgi:Domain of unknown function (DUF4349)
MSPTAPASSVSPSPLRHARPATIVFGLVLGLTAGLAACSRESPEASAARDERPREQKMEMAADAAASESFAGAPASEAAAQSAPAALPQARLEMPTAARRSAEAEADGAMVDADIASANAVADASSAIATPPVSPDQLSSSAAAGTPADGNRKFVRTANARFQVKDVYRSALAVEDAAVAQGGFVVRNDIGSQVLRSERVPLGDHKALELREYTVTGNLTVRVPSDRAQAFLRAIAPQMEFLDQRVFQANDVQLQLLRQQLEFRRNAQLQQTLGGLADQPGRIGDRTQAAYGSSEAQQARDEALLQRREFEDRVEFATIELALYQSNQLRRSEVVDTNAVFEDHRPGLLRRIGESLAIGWYWLMDLLIVALAAWPFWLVVSAVVYGLLRWRRRRNAARD